MQKLYPAGPETDPVTALLPRVGKNYNPPYLKSVPTGSGYTWLPVTRPSILQALTPSTVGTIFAYPRVAPPSDTDAIPSTNGLMFLDAVGDWYIRHTSGTAEVFRIIDAGGAGNAQAALGAIAQNSVNLIQIGGTAQTALNLTSLFVALTMASPDTQTVGAASASILAASSTRRFVYVRNTHATQRASLAFGAAAVLDSGITLNPNEWVNFSAPTGHVTQEVFAIGSGAGTTLAIQTGT